MKKRTWGVIFVIIVITLIITSTFLILSSRYTGLFIKFREEVCLFKREEVEQYFCDQKAVEKILEKIESLRIYQKNIKSGELKYLGAPSYIIPKKKYPHVASVSNVYMKENFMPLYQVLQDHLEERTGIKCYYPGLDDKSIALPGFHLFQPGKYLSSGWRVASVHVDLQYNRVTWPEDFIFDESRTISFTLALSIPGGSGIYFFDAEKGNVQYRFPRYRTYNNMKYQKVNYRPGHLYLHDGHRFHMISEFYSETIPRVTLQGHGIYCRTDNKYWLYW